MKKELNNPPKYQNAYMVHSWGSEIIKGNAFILEYNDGWFKTIKAFFIADGEDIPATVDAKQVVFTEQHAQSLLAREIKARKEYYEKQIKEAQDKLALL